MDKNPPQSNKACVPQPLKPTHSRALGPQLSPYVATTETLKTWSLCFTAREATAVKSLCVTAKSSPHLPQLEKARARQQRPSGAPNQSINQYNYKKESLKKKQREYWYRPSQMGKPKRSLSHLYDSPQGQERWIRGFCTDPHFSRELTRLV